MDETENPLKIWRFENGFTQEEAAEQVGVVGATWGSWERGVCLPLPFKAKLIRDATGVTYAQLSRWKKNAFRAVA